MTRKLAVAAGVIAVILRGSVSAQGPDSAARVDFGRDVLPILKQNCISCHGPTIRQKGLRLDVRRAAMRGGTTTPGVIRPGESQASLLFFRISSNQFGPQMPPTGALRPEQIATIKAWIDQGAEWPDELAGSEGPPVPTPPLMTAVLRGGVNEVHRLLDHGADVNARNGAGATALMWATNDFEKTRLLLERGAQVDAKSDDGRTALLIAAGQPGASAIVKLLLERGANPSIKGPGLGGETNPLMEAATIGDAAIVRLLVEHGADVKAAGYVGLAFALHAQCFECFDILVRSMDRQTISIASLVASPPLGDATSVTRLLDRGADATLKDSDGNTLLMRAVSSDLFPLDTIRTLIARGADVNATSTSGASMLAVARRHGQTTPVVDLLLQAGAKDAPAPSAPVLNAAPAASPRAAVERALPLLQQTDVTFLKKSGCVSCHNNTLAAMTVAIARSKGIRVDEETARQQLDAITTFIDSWRDRALQGISIPGDADTVSYILLGLSAENSPASDATEAMARLLKRQQRPDGRWRILAHRPPIEASDIEVTAASMRSLQIYAPASERAAYDQAVRRAAAWLAKARARTTEERAFQLLGLAWSGARKRAIQKAAKALIAEQRADGGWSQLPTLTSDAYATGQALVALEHSATLAISDPVYRRGVKFLLNSQLEDGSWFVKTRALPIQLHFESGFPHGKDQFISAAASNWAAMALALAVRPGNATSPSQPR